MSAFRTTEWWKRKRPYDAWLVWQTTERCNLNCAYCFAHNNPVKETEKIAKINIPAFLRTLEKTNKIFLLNLGGGEPFLVPNIIEACLEITKKHYITVITNLTSNKVKDFAEKIDAKKIEAIVASLHIKELERSNLLDNYINNFLLLKKKGFRIFANEVAYPPLLNEVEKYKKFFKEKGIELRFIPFCQSNYKGKEYPESYTDEELKIFGIDKGMIERNYQYGKICNAGYNTGIVYTNGDIYPCYSIKERLGNIYKKIEFKKNLRTCPVKFCSCPLKVYNQYLFEKALKEKNMEL